MAGHSDIVKVQALPDPPNQTETEKIAQSIIPYSRDDARARYLGLRSSGLSVREALRLMHYAHSTLSLWRKDSAFVVLEEDIPKYRKQLSTEYVGIEFVRNMRLILEKDYRVLQASLNPKKDNDGDELPMDEQDFAYLQKMRSHYSPQQLQIMETILGAEAGGGFDMTEFAIQLSKTQGEVTVRARTAQEVIISSGGSKDG